MYHYGERRHGGGGYACLGAEGRWKISVPSLQCWCEPKTALKKSLNLNIYIYKIALLFP